MTTFRILGPIEAFDGGRALPLGGQRQLVLLAALLLNANRALSTDALIDFVWGGPGARPEAAMKRLQMAVARLRAVIEPPPGDREEPMLRTVSGGYLLTLPAGRLDAHVFEAQLEEGRDALASGDPTRASEMLRGALGRWRGPALAEVAFADFAQPEIRRLEELRLVALEARIDADLILGRHDAVVAELTALVARHPARERFAGQLMLALYRGGRQAEALDVYQRTRGYLAAELGLSPGPALEAAQRAILNHEPSPWSDAIDGHARLEPATPGADSTKVALPAITPRVQAGAFVGRDECLERLRAAWRQARTGPTSVVLVAGPAGIGKTRLAARFAEEIHADGGTILYGRADAESLATFQPFVEALRHLLTRGGEAFAGETTPEREVLSRLLPDLGPPGHDATADASETLRYRLFEAVAALLARATRRWPVLLVLDDLHWADRPTLLLLRHLLRHPDLARLLVIVTFRPAERDAAPALSDFLAELRRDRRCDSLELTGLDLEATGALVSDRLGAEPAPGLVRRLHEQTGGNAFFIEETVRALRDTEGEATEAALDRLGVPEGIAEVILRHIRRLSPLAAEVLSAAAVVGHEFPLAVAAQLVAEPVDDVIAALEEGLASHLIVEIEGAPDTFAFVHAVVRDALYSQLTGVRRSRLHLRVAQALESLHDEATRNPAELAHHYDAARHLAGREPARRYALLAGQRAAQLFSYEEAADHFRRALELLDPGQEEERCELLLALGRVQYHGSDPAARETFLRAADSARRRGAAEQLARAALGLAERYWETAYVGSRLTELLEEAAALLGDTDSPLRALVLARLAENLAFPARDERAPALSAEALAIARRLGDEDVLIHALLARHVTRLDIRDLDERLALMDELLQRAGDHLELAAERHQWRLYDLLEAGRVEAARQDHARLEALAAELRQPLFQTLAVGWRGVLAELAGDIELAEDCANECRRLAERAHARDAQSTWAAKVFALRRRAGRLAEIEALTEQLAREERPGWPPALGILRAELGDFAAAQDILDELLRDGPEAVPEGMFRLVTLALLADLCATLGDARHGASLYRALTPYAHRYVVIAYSSWWGPVERFLAMLAETMGDVAGAERHARAALSRAHDIGAPLLAADIQQRHAHLLGEF